MIRSTLTPWLVPLILLITTPLWYVIIMGQHFQYIEELQQQAADRVLNRAESISNEFHRAHSELTKIATFGCDDDKLVAMRRQVFSSQFIKDIGYFDGNTLVCTTGLGVINIETSPRLSDMIGSDKKAEWFRMPILLFDEQIKAIVIREDTYNAVFRLDDLENVETAPFVWELFFSKNGQIKSAFGEQGLLADFQQSNQVFDSIFSPSVYRCSDSVDFCVIIKLRSVFSAPHFGVFNALSLLSAFLLSGLTAYFFHRRFIRYHSLSSRIERGLKSGAFYSLFQPIIDMETNQIIGCEMLARFEDADGALYPDEFIPEIRKLQRTWSFTEVLVAQALEELKTLNFPTPFRFSFNVFPADVINGDVLKVNDIMGVSDCPYDLVLEITEDEYLDEEKAQNHLRDIHKLGHEVAVDDFGTGYSNLNQLQKIQCQILKIDRSFVMDIEAGSIKSSLVKHIIDIAHNMSLKVVAEGVENVLQKDALASLGVAFGQGWAFGRPMSAQKLIDQINEQTN